jgi:hypothetical protein
LCPGSSPIRFALSGFLLFEPFQRQTLAAFAWHALCTYQNAFDDRTLDASLGFKRQTMDMAALAGVKVVHG